MDSKKKNKTIILVIIFAVVLILIGIFSIIFNRSMHGSKENNMEIILNDTGIVTYLERVFPSTKLGENLIDDINITNLISDSDTVKYQIEFKEIQESKMQYVNFLEYSKLYKEKYGKEINIKDFDDIININNIKKVNDTSFVVSNSDVTACTKNNINTCYFTHPMFLANEGSITFKNLNNTDDIITGEVIKEITHSSKKYQYSGEFELKYEKNAGKYNVLSFMVTKINS